MFISADGYEVRPGDTVYIKQTHTYYEEKKVFTVPSDYKLVYDTPDSQGYAGARYTVVYKNKPEFKE